MRLLHDLESYEGEDKCLAEYRKELELLQQEKMAHVEELRQIHSDINAVSNPIHIYVRIYLLMKLSIPYFLVTATYFFFNVDGNCNEASRGSKTQCSKLGSQFVG